MTPNDTHLYLYIRALIRHHGKDLGNINPKIWYFHQILPLRVHGAKQKWRQKECKSYSGNKSKLSAHIWIQKAEAEHTGIVTYLWTHRTEAVQTRFVTHIWTHGTKAVQTRFVSHIWTHGTEAVHTRSVWICTNLSQSWSTREHMPSP